MDVYAMLDAQSKTIKKLQEENRKTVLEANRLMLKYQAAINIAQSTIEVLRELLKVEHEKVKKLECEALSRSWDVEGGEHKKRDS